ncbi:hypothetical protein [Testudinibacter sp. TR-2022]|uniref:hypothetical protein n=1 Tax=Testudinibacter sp. TR-2022 TaxID=2585029 RepID=UPI003FA36127
MARTVKILMNTQVDKAKPSEKPYHLADGGGLYLLVKPKATMFPAFLETQLLLVQS